ncbi:hypothetical protein D3C80_2084990 [compost metagenome]
MVQTLLPLTIQPPSVFTARVRTEARSEPTSGSLMPMQNSSSPRAMAGSKRGASTSGENFISKGPDWRSAIQCAFTGAPAASSSSRTT